MSDETELQTEDQAPAQVVEKPKRGAKAKVREAAPNELVRMRVLKKGAGRISTGEHVPGEGDVFYAQGDEFYAPAESVEDLEERALAEAV